MELCYSVFLRPPGKERQLCWRPWCFSTDVFFIAGTLQRDISELSWPIAARHDEKLIQFCNLGPKIWGPNKKNWEPKKSIIHQL